MVQGMRTSFLLCAVYARRAHVPQRSVSDTLLCDVESGVVRHWEDFQHSNASLALSTQRSREGDTFGPLYNQLFDITK